MIESQVRRSESAIYKDVLGYLLNTNGATEQYLVREFNLSWVFLMKMVKRGLLNVDLNGEVKYYADSRKKKLIDYVYWTLKGGGQVKLPEFNVFLAARPIIKTTVDGNKISVVGVRMESAHGMELLGTVTTPEGEVYSPWKARTPLPVTTYLDVERNVNNVLSIKRKCKVIDVWD